MCVHDLKGTRGRQVRGVTGHYLCFQTQSSTCSGSAYLGFLFLCSPPFFWLLYWWMYSKCSLTFLFLPFFFCGTREKVLRLLRSWIKHMNMTKSLVTSVSLQWVLASWSQTRHVLFMSQRILSDSLHFYRLLIPKFQRRNGWLRRQDTRVELQILPACKDKDIYLISGACSCDLSV